jgi:hypothetical protein
MQNSIDSISSACNEIVRNDSEMLRWRFGVTQEELSHIAMIASSIVMHKKGIRNGGGFVEAVCSDSLTKSAGRADSTMQKVLAYMATFVDRAETI